MMMTTSKKMRMTRMRMMMTILKGDENDDVNLLEDKNDGVNLLEDKNDDVNL